MSHPAFISEHHTAHQQTDIDVPAVEREHLGDTDVAEVSYWLVDARDWAAGQRALASIRQNPCPHVYLKPVVLITADSTLPAKVRDTADLHVNIDGFRGKLPDAAEARFQSIRNYIAGLPDAIESSDKTLSFRVLRFLASRDNALQAHMTADHHAGFVYPALLPFFTEQDNSHLQVLEFLESQRLIRGEFQARAHLCRQCGCAFLNFTEACPDCASPNLHVDELIHHFRCAHTAPMDEFRQQGELVCPKCDHNLQHIGVDYDKPSMTYQCNSCNSRFQDPVIVSTCFNCGHSAEPEQQTHQEIKRYNLTSIGRNAAIYGLDNLFTQLLENEITLQPFPVFRQFLQVEVARIKRYALSASSLLFIDLEDLDKLYLSVGRRAGEVFGELGALFRAVLRDSDVISSRSESVFVILLTETSDSAAQIALQRLTQGIRDLLTANLEYDPKIRHRIVGVDAMLDLDAVTEAFLKDHAD